MKKILSIIAVAGLIILSVIYTGCKKNDSFDTQKPLVTINGSSVYYMQKGWLYYDANATAIDAVDGTLPVVSSGGPNINVVGTYVITYTATDKAGNMGTASRTVYVVDLVGTYSVVGKVPFPVVSSTATSHYTDQLFLASDMGGQLNYTTFANYGVAAYSYLTSGSSINIPSQTYNCGTPAINRTFSGSGSITRLHGAVQDTTQITIDYTETDSTFTVHGRDVYKKTN